MFFVFVVERDSSTGAFVLFSSLCLQIEGSLYVLEYRLLKKKLRNPFFTSFMFTNKRKSPQSVRTKNVCISVLSCDKSWKDFQFCVRPDRGHSSPRTRNSWAIHSRTELPLHLENCACASHAWHNHLASPRFFTVQATPPIRGLQESIRGNYAFT